MIKQGLRHKCTVPRLNLPVAGVAVGFVLMPFDKKERKKFLEEVFRRLRKEGVIK